jgi:hypothetical protein
MLWLNLIILIALFSVGIGFLMFAFAEQEIEFLIIAGIIMAFAALVSEVLPISVETKIYPFTAENAHNILYVKIGDTIQEFDKLADIERFKNAKETNVEVYYNSWKRVKSYNVLVPAENEIP